MLLYNTNHRWIYVIVSATILDGLVPKGRNPGPTLEPLKEFIAKLVPQIIKQRALLASKR
jgi:hypothetical protein